MLLVLTNFEIKATIVPCHACWDIYTRSLLSIYPNKNCNPKITGLLLMKRQKFRTQKAYANKKGAKACMTEVKQFVSEQIYKAHQTNCED